MVSAEDRSTREGKRKLSDKDEDEGVQIANSEKG